VSNRNRTARRRASAAYDTLRGRAPKPDYGILVIFPLLAAIGGVLLSLAVESAIERRRAIETTGGEL
jgi:hypothetical protein